MTTDGAATEIGSGPRAHVRTQVVEALRRSILDFELAPGHRLVERELIERLGVSRTTVREALGELKAEGLVTVVPHRGATVTMPSEQEAKDLYEIRFRLESLVVERFTERASDEMVDQLGQAVETLAAAVESNAPVHELLQARDGIFLVLHEGADSATLRQLTETIRARLSILRAISVLNHQRMAESIVDWRAMVEAIRLRDSAQASSVFLGHMHKAASHALAAARDPRRIQLLRLGANG